MTSPTHQFLTLIPASHTTNVANTPVVAAFPLSTDEVVTATQKTRRSSSSTSAGSDSVGSPLVGAVDPDVVPVEAKGSQGFTFLRLGN